MAILSAFANPHRFMAFSNALLPWLGAGAAILITYSIWQGLYVLPPEAYQGDSARIMIVHVPAAWLSMGGYMGMAVASLVWFVWRHEIADVAAKSMAVFGAGYTAICLMTGAVWGKPTWGTWFQWDDARMVSVLVMFFIYVGYIALRAAMDTRQKAARAGAILAMVGAINVPIIKFSVDIWASLHQDASVLRLDGPAMAPEFLTPLLLGALGHTLLFAALVLVAMRAEVRLRRADALMMRRMAGA